MKDLREELFERISRKRVTACLYTDMDGVLSGMSTAEEIAGRLGLQVTFAAKDGDEVFCGDLLMQVSGSPVMIARAEDSIIGPISKYSGVATAARSFVKSAGHGVQIVCGSWKKMPDEIKTGLRNAIETGGAAVRMLDEPMIYLDKNYVRMFGGIQNSLIAADRFDGRKKVIQIKGYFEGGDIVREAWTAVTSGADIIYIDTGRIEDLRRVTEKLKPMLERLRQKENYREIRFAFGGGVTLDDIPTIREAGADIVGVGRKIIDAPLMDLRLEVTEVMDPADSHAGYSLLDKSELKIEGITLEQTNLTDLAAIVAEEIGVDSEDVLVIDVRDGAVALDILQKSLDPEQFISKEGKILGRLREIKGVTLAPDARITSDGMLGWIAGDDSDILLGQAEAAKSKNLGEQLVKNISKRVIVFPTGSEVESGEIEDTNTPLIMKKFTEAGFCVDKGEILKDDIRLFTGKLWQAAERGYSVSITTGGVGAENKDFSVEAIQNLDPQACTPYIAKFKQGTGRHSKDGIRIGVGQMGFTTYVALPGPNDEVAVCIDTVVRGISEGWSKEVLAGKLARLLRDRLKDKIGIMMQKHHDIESK